MGFIIVWRNSHREPHIDVDSHGFKEEYNSYEDAKEEAENIQARENEGSKSPWYFDFQIYQSVDS